MNVFLEEKCNAYGLQIYGDRCRLMKNPYI